MSDLVKNIAGFMNEPVPSFFFEVVFMEKFDPKDKIGLIKATASVAMQALDSVATAFSDIQGLTVSYKTNAINEAGWSSPRPTFQRVDNDELTLVRYLRPRHIGMGGFSLDPVTGWCQETMDTVKTWEQQVKKKDIMVFIYHPMIQNPIKVGPSSFPVAGFMLQEAFPTSWGISDLSSTAGDAPLKETIKFKYTEIQRLSIPSPF